MLNKRHFQTSCGMMAAYALALPVAVMAVGPATPVTSASSAAVVKPLATKPLVAKPAEAPPQPVTRAGLATELEREFRALDTNKDGYLSQAEIAAGQVNRQKQLEALARKRREAAFTAMDTNKDGQLSHDEFLANNVMAKRPMPNGAKALVRLDANKDGRLTLAEYTALMLSNFDKSDANHDAVLSPEEGRVRR
jgi:Ca2+-binding EF-hand superfamily protein